MKVVHLPFLLGHGARWTTNRQDLRGHQHILLTNDALGPAFPSGTLVAARRVKSARHLKLGALYVVQMSAKSQPNEYEFAGWMMCADPTDGISLMEYEGRRYLVNVGKPDFRDPQFALWEVRYYLSIPNLANAA